MNANTTTTFHDLPQQERVVLNHLIAKGDITNVEAHAVHRIRSVSRRITTLIDAGCRIEKEHRKDTTGQRYVRYRLVSAPARLTGGSEVRRAA